MESLVKEDLIEPIKAFISSGKPYLGICLGMQILYESSEESPLVGGIGKFSGKVNKFSHKSNSMLTHNGWNEIAKVSDRDDVLGISDKSSFYFNHSYFVSSTGSEVRAVTRNGDQFPSIVMRDNVIGVQFHPEKSQENGTKFLSRFLKL
jgi:glutamine amidotransferase